MNISMTFIVIARSLCNFASWITSNTFNLYTIYRVRQGCILSPLLFNIYAEKTMREALYKWEGGISIGGRLVTNLKKADDTTLISGTKEDLIEIMESIENKRESGSISKCPEDEGHDNWRYWRGDRANKQNKRSRKTIWNEN